MSLKKRHIGRRVAGIGVGVALMVLGLQAPAMADTTVSAVAPTSGPTNCVVDITGTGFAVFPDSSNTLTFVGPAAGAGDDVNVLNANWFSLSDTEIWARVPVLTAGTSYTVVLTQPSGTNTAGGTFLSTGATSAGACAPTITSFTPTCSSAGVVVTITGTNLLDATNLTGTNSGGDVYFQDTTPPATTLASQPVPDLSSPTSISAIVPSNVADGPIEVRTDVDASAAGGFQGAFSTTSFLTPPPDCVPVTGNEHARAITFKLKKSGKASGVLSSTEDPAFTDCVAAAPVKIQKKKKGDGWKTKATATTDDTGSYSATINAKPGKYRALAPKVSLGDPVTDVCLKTKSAARKIG